MNIDVMSFNLRYWNKADGPNAWPNRRSAVVSVIQRFDPLVMGTQEGLPEMLADLDTDLPDYARIGRGRGSDEADEFCAIYYRSDVLELIAEGQFWLSTTPEVPGSRSWDSSLPRICTWGHFRTKDEELEFVMFNTHLDHEGEDARRLGAELLWERMRPFVERGLPCILTGDFNCEPQSIPIQFLRERLTDALEDKGAGGATFHGFSGVGVGGWIDYIFVSANVGVVSAEVIRDKVDGRFPSDHYPIRARLELPVK